MEMLGQPGAGSDSLVYLDKKCYVPLRFYYIYYLTLPIDDFNKLLSIILNNSH